MRRFAIASVLAAVALSTALTASGDTPVRSFRPVERRPLVVDALRRDISRPIRTVKGGLLDQGDPAASRRTIESLQASAPLADFPGIHAEQGFVPPDTNGDVSPTQYVQGVNVAWAVFAKDGRRLYGPAEISTLWRGFGGPCEKQDDGDPIVQWDPLAERWVISQFAIPGGVDTPPFYECIAVSETDDATGRYYRYSFLMSKRNFPDYPKFGIWSDGYYMSVNLFNAKSGFSSGQGVVAFEKEAMMQGGPARMIKFSNSDFDGMLPSDLTGRTAPPPGAPNYLVIAQDDNTGDPADQLVLYEFHADWNDPDASEIRGPALLEVAPFKSTLCGGAFDCVPQKGSPWDLDPIAGNQLMYPLMYRNFGGSHESLVLTQAVNMGKNRAGIRWYELRAPGPEVELYQQGTYGPGRRHRFVSSASMDSGGNIALGYSISSDDIFPGIAYTSRLAGDPLGQMTQEERFIAQGGGAQRGANRWGDYSSMQLDPVDDCTFWFTSEYYEESSDVGWSTRIASFRLPGCQGAQPTTTPTPAPEPATHDRSITLDLNKHLVAQGTLTAMDGFEDCVDGVPVDIELRFYGEWYPYKTTFAIDGEFRARMDDYSARYRAVARETSPIDQPNQTCAAAISPLVRHKD